MLNTRTNVLIKINRDQIYKHPIRNTLVNRVDLFLLSSCVKTQLAVLFTRSKNEIGVLVNAYSRTRDTVCTRG